MLIERTHIRNLENYLVGIPPGASVVPAIDLAEVSPERLAAIGFKDLPQEGETVLAAPLGRVSHFNADGGWTVHRDQPKGRRYIRTVGFTRLEWHGKERQERPALWDIFRECYPRTRILPPGVELTCVARDGHGYLVAGSYLNLPEDHAALRHAINLLLEIFGRCELLTEDLDQFARVPRQRLTWRLLPPGEHPWPRLREHLDQVLGRAGDGIRRVILERQETVLGHEPDAIHVGIGGYRDYVAYEFRARGLVVLECIRQDNALYIFGADWQEVARLTKAEVLQANRHRARITHQQGWKERLAEVLGPEPVDRGPELAPVA